MDTTLPQIAGYTLLSRAGQGGMGTVYRAEQISPRRSVAIKMLSGANITAAQMTAFRREAEVVAHLEHPGIVPLYDYGETAGTPYLVLRYLAGGSVADRLRAGPLDVATTARWIGGIAARTTCRAATAVKSRVCAGAGARPNAMRTAATCLRPRRRSFVRSYAVCSSPVLST